MPCWRLKKINEGQGHGQGHKIKIILVPMERYRHKEYTCEYQSPSSKCSKVITKVKVFCNRQTDKKIDAPLSVIVDKVQYTQWTEYE